MAQLQKALRITRDSVTLATFILVAACNTAADYPFMKEGQPHAEAIVAVVAREWKADELINVADPQMLEVLPKSEIKKMIAACSHTLGRLKQQQTLSGSSGVTVGAGAGKFVSYLIELRCEKATATVKINLHKIDSKWLVLGFWVDMHAPRPI